MHIKTTRSSRKALKNFICSPCTCTCSGFWSVPSWPKPLRACCQFRHSESPSPPSLSPMDYTYPANIYNWSLVVLLGFIRVGDVVVMAGFTDQVTLTFVSLNHIPFKWFQRLPIVHFLLPLVVNHPIIAIVRLLAVFCAHDHFLVLLVLAIIALVLASLTHFYKISHSLK